MFSGLGVQQHQNLSFGKLRGSRDVHTMRSSKPCREFLPLPFQEQLRRRLLLDLDGSSQQWAWCLRVFAMFASGTARGPALGSSGDLPPAQVFNFADGRSTRLYWVRPSLCFQ